MLNVYNTLTRKKEIFTPLRDRSVTYYHCGPTVYSFQHIGNCRGAFVADSIVRTLRYLGYSVTFVSNITDVGHLVSDDDEGEDKMEKATKREKKTSLEIAQFYANDFLSSVKKLNMVEPDKRPRPTEHIEDQINLIQTLHKKGYAYETKSAVYFDVSKMEDYGSLSGQPLNEKLVTVREDVVSDPDKRNPQDFALWFFTVGRHKNHELRWQSPWGEGFPGWHIECSAMSMKYLGDTIDLHSGGVEHIPVHHENEIAQSECATGQPFVRYWIHFEHLVVDNKKMSKSLGNVYLLQGKKSETGFESIEEQGFHPLDLRYFFLQAHYRQKQNFTFKALDGARNAREKLREHINQWQREGSGDDGVVIKKMEAKFRASIEDDFNMPQALAIAHQLVSSHHASEDKLATIKAFDMVLGLNLIQRGDKQSNTVIDIDELETALELRQHAREGQEWERADQIRKELEEKFNVEIEDTPEGTVWKPRVY